jgi:DNA-binding SARP family transcriptional activator
MEFGVLGPVEVWAHGRPMDAGHARQRAVLAVLLLDPGRAVAPEVLIDRVWGEDPPRSVRNVLYGYVARLKALLASGQDPVVSLSRATGGYLLRARPEQVDLARFRRLVAEAAAGDDERAVAELGRALALWRGPALAGQHSPWLNAMRTTLELERSAAVLDLNDIRLRLGEHAALVGELVAQAAAAPADERLTGQLMVALYRCGRQADALRWFERTRRRLADELGADPGPQLAALHQQILRADPCVALPSVAVPATGPGALIARCAPDNTPAPRELPADVSAFTGRTAELHRLDQLLSCRATYAGRMPTAVISAVSGTAGVGKTALAVHWAHRVVDRFPDGQLHVNMRGYDPAQPMAPADALAVFLRALGVPDQDIPVGEDQRAARYRSLLAGKRVLIVVDNARTSEQVRPLLPGAYTCAVVVTSRDSLAGLVARDGAARLDLDVLPLGDAVTLLCDLLGARADADLPATAELARQCSRLPLALRVAAELAASRPEVPLTDLIAELADEQKRLDVLDAGGDPRTAVSSVFSWSYRHLDPDVARAFRLTSLHPGPDFDSYAVAALLATTFDQAGGMLDALSRAHLIHPTGPGRYGMHDLLRIYGRGLKDAEQGEEQALEALARLTDHYVHAAAGAIALPRRSVAPAAALMERVETPRWLVEQRAVLIAAAAEFAGPRHATRLDMTLLRRADAILRSVTAFIAAELDRCRPPGASVPAPRAPEGSAANELVGGDSGRAVSSSH